MQDLPEAFPALLSPACGYREDRRPSRCAQALPGLPGALEFVRKKIVSASIYPVLLMGVGFWC